MSGSVGQAMEQALAYHRAPTMLSGAQGRPLPEGMMTLLRLAGGDQAMIAQCVEASGETEQDVVSAAVFFIQQVMFAPGADSYRVLGVDAETPDARIKEHYRWLVRWLHPDRNTDDWDSVYADRVNIAWQDLRTPDRRQAYDQLRSSGAALAEDDFGDASILERRPVRVPRPAPEAPAPGPEPGPEPEARLSVARGQQLPTVVLGGLGGAAVVLLFLMWWASDPHDLVGGQGGLVSTGATSMPPALALEERPDAVAAAQPDAPVLPPPQPEAGRAPMPAPAPVAEPAPATVAVQPAPVSPTAPVPARQPAVVGRTITPEVAPVAEPPATIAATPEPAPMAAPEVAPAVTPAAPAPTAVTARPALSRPAPVETPAPAAPAAESRPQAAAVPATAAAPAAPAAAAKDTPQLAEAHGHALLARFSDAYRAGDINSLMRLFTADARNNRGGREAIVYDYQSLFSASESRELRLQPTGWMPRDDGATLLASYEARVQTPGRRREEVSRGSIRFDMRLVNGEARISLVRHD